MCFLNSDFSCKKLTPYFRIKHSLFKEQNEVKREFVGVSSGLFG
ncbi:hypothetical protein [Helicobacter pylori]